MRWEPGVLASWGPVGVRSRGVTAGAHTRLPAAPWHPCAPSAGSLPPAPLQAWPGPRRLMVLPAEPGPRAGGPPLTGPLGACGPHRRGSPRHAWVQPHGAGGRALQDCDVQRSDIRGLGSLFLPGTPVRLSRPTSVQTRPEEPAGNRGIPTATPLHPAGIREAPAPLRERPGLGWGSGGAAGRLKSRLGLLAMQPDTPHRQHHPSWDSGSAPDGV